MHPVWYQNAYALKTFYNLFDSLSFYFYLFLFIIFCKKTVTRNTKENIETDENKRNL